MFKQLRNGHNMKFSVSFKNKRAQNTAEYALLIALVIAGVIAMQTYAQRSLQGRMRDAGSYLTRTTDNIGSTNQYEPYYMQSNYDVSRDSESYKRLDNSTTAYDTKTNRVRAEGGFEKMKYDDAGVKQGV